MVLYNPIKDDFNQLIGVYSVSNRDNKTKLLVTTALLTALVLVCTLLLKIPVGPDCYVHLGDAVILLAVILLPRPYACFAGSVGATLADLMGGFAFWAPWTFIVKLIFVLVFGFFLDRARKHPDAQPSVAGLNRAEFIGLIVSGIVAVIGYFICEYILFGAWLPAATCIPFNCIQVSLGAVIAELLAKRIHLNL